MTSTQKFGKMKPNRKKFKCPVCGQQTLFFPLPNTEVKNLPVWCKTCKQEVIVNIPFEP